MFSSIYLIYYYIIFFCKNQYYILDNIFCSWYDINIKLLKVYTIKLIVSHIKRTSYNKCIVQFCTNKIQENKSSVLKTEKSFMRKSYGLFDFLLSHNKERRKGGYT